jgi:hypothetical protein
VAFYRDHLQFGDPSESYQMQMLVNSVPVVMSGVALVNIPAELFIKGDDGTTLDLVWSSQYDVSSTGGTEDLRSLWGHFPAKKPASPSISEWVVRDLKTGGTLTARVYTDHVSGNSIAVTFTVLAGEQEQ